MRAFLIPAILAAGAVVSTLLARSIAPSFAIDFAQALPVATNWGVAGVLAWIPLACSIAAAGAIWYTLLDRPPQLRVTLIVSAISLASALCWTPIFSSDVYAYAAYGDMSRLGLDPYVAHPALANPIVRAAEWQWSGSLPVCVYGEAFVALARAIVTATAGAPLSLTLFAFRIVACLALLACAALARGRAAFFIACNPLAIYACAEGHNDILMIALVLIGAIVARRSPFAGAAIAGAAAAIKAPALAAAWTLAALRAIERNRTVAAAAGALAGSVIAVLASLRLIHGALSHIARHGSYHAFASAQSLSPFAAVALAVFVALRLRTFAATYDRAVACGFIVWLAIPNPYPWYGLWLLVPAAFAFDRRIADTAIVIAAASLLRYLPDAAGEPSLGMTLAMAVACSCAYLPLLGRPRVAVV
jgi:hypothetical protein